LFEGLAGWVILAVMNVFGYLIASGDMDGQGGSNTGTYLLVAALIVVAVLMYRNQLRKARARVNVRPSMRRERFNYLNQCR